MILRKLVFPFLFFFFPFFLIAQIDHYETAIYNTDNWVYLIGNSEPSFNWTKLDYGESGWKIGKGGIGYGDNDDGTVIAPARSVYIRNHFTIVDKAAIVSAILQADYDDAFVAYLNGVEIARANISGTPPRFNTEPNGLHEATLYQGGVPESFFISKTKIEELFIEGENVLAIQIHNKEGTNSSDLSSNFFLTIGINDESRNYRPTPVWFLTNEFTTDLPIIKITTSDLLNGENRVDGQLEIINKAEGANEFVDPPNEYQGNITIKIRGQSSQFFPKKNYSFETQDLEGNDLDTSFLSFPKEEDWILHGPFSDKSLMRNVLTAELAKRMGQYASRTQYCEVFINSDYQGIYVLMEQIKRGKNRVAISKLKDTDIEGNELTGGYIFKIDKDEADWFSQFNVYQENRKLEFQLVYPDVEKVQPEQFEYIQSYVDSFELAMDKTNLTFGGKSFDEYIDLKSFAEAHLLNEFGRNVDGYRLSSYFHKKKNSEGGRINAGPVWDFNLAFRNADYCDGANTNGLIYYRLCDGGYPFWWNTLLTNPEFTTLMNCRWKELREGGLHTDSIFAFIDEQVAIIEPALDRNFKKWNIFGTYVWPNPAPLANSYEEEIELLKQWIETRAEWMDNNLLGSCPTVGIEELEVKRVFTIAPNPVNNKLTISILNQSIQKVEAIQLWNSMGQIMESFTTSSSTVLDVSQLPNGFYFLGVKMEGKWIQQKVIVQH